MTTWTNRHTITTEDYNNKNKKRAITKLQRFNNS